MRSRFVICFLFLMLTLLAVAPVSSLRVDNSILEADVAPGEHIRHEMIVRLSEDEQAVDAEAKVMGFGTNIHGAIQALEKENDKSLYSAREFFNISPESFRLEPGLPVEVILEGDVPEDVGSGGRYAIVDITTAPQGNGTIGFVAEVIVPIYLTINGTDLVKTGEIVEADISKDGILSMTFSNTGNYFYGVLAEVFLKDESNKVIGNFSSQRGTALPAVPYPFTISLNPEGDLAPGIYTVEANVVLKNGAVLDTTEETFEL